jgi:hypothetical protein
MNTCFALLAVVAILIISGGFSVLGKISFPIVTWFLATQMALEFLGTI